MDGNLVANEIRKKIEEQINFLCATGIRPCLATILVGDNQASATYVKNKHIAAAKLGISTRDYKLEESTSETELIDLIENLNSNKDIHGILVQIPLPTKINQQKVVNSINHLKDVDGLNPFNLGLLFGSEATLKPCTPSGILEIIDFYGIDMKGMDVVIVNRSNLVGKPLSMMLLQRDATVTICHSKSKNLSKKLGNADCIITAIGNRDKFVLTGSMVKKNSIIIDVGITRNQGRISGDVDFESVKKMASYITPVPGGVGPMTITMLLKNTVIAAEMIKNSKQD
jgi:methylenetetrahydrofolate dehydrogenase (NADP+) / methenyltetrahydrofolate cyclohydrolase